MANRETREIYRGKAIILGVSFEGVEDWKDWEKKTLPESDINSAFKIVYDVAEGDHTGNRHEVKIEVSHRELTGKMLEYYKREDGATPTQIDFAIRSLVGQAILQRGATEESLSAAISDDLCGREVSIRVYEELGNDGVTWWPRCVFASKFKRITGEDKAARLAAFLSGQTAPKVEDAPRRTQSDAGTLPLADEDEMPF